jgi:osomolarity two-component system, sensor histidine kinase NIK1
MAETFTMQVRATSDVTSAIAHGDLTRKMKLPVKGEILVLQLTINAAVDHLRSFCAEVTSVVRDVGTEGNLGGQVGIKNIEGTWNTLAVNVNAMATTLTTQVRDIDEVATAVAEGNFTQRLSPVGKGEILELRSTINSMIDQLQQLQGPSEA